MACIRRVEELSTDPNFVGYYDIEEARRQDIEDAKETGIRIGKEEGIKEGVKEGIVESKNEIAKNLLLLNVKIEDISRATNLSIEEIEGLK